MTALPFPFSMLYSMCPSVTITSVLDCVVLLLNFMHAFCSPTAHTSAAAHQQAIIRMFKVWQTVSFVHCYKTAEVETNFECLAARYCIIFVTLLDTY